VRLLLDTHILLWWLADDRALPQSARALIAEPENEVFVSAISLWEIAIKSRLGKLRADVEQVREATIAGDFAPLPFRLEHSVEVARLPDLHQDPFDRALIAQARLEPLALLTHDAVLTDYGDVILPV
jgi:PIN domain nuclease of toxin-antitoxin system